MRRVLRVTELIRRYGLAGLRISWAVYRREPVPIPGIGMLPYDGSAVYHVLESVEKLRRLAAYVRPGDVVFDIGAHAGLFSVMASREGGRIVAVEPDPEVGRLLLRNTDGLNVEVVEAAMAETTEQVTLWRNPTSTQTSSLIRSAAEVFGEVEAVEVPAVTWQVLVDRFGMPDVVKLDVQGYESRLLSNIPVEQLTVLLVEVSDLDEVDLTESLTNRFGMEPTVVNEIAMGADLAFTRDR